MIRISVDCNWREDLNEIVLPDASVTEFDLKGGERIVLFEPGMECEAIVRRGKTWPWIAEIIQGTVKEVPYEETPLT